MNTTPSSVLSAAALAAGSAVVLLWLSKKRQQERLQHNPNENIVDLLPVEKVLAGGGGGDNAISTLTWFKGDYHLVKEPLEQRAAALLQANPWLGGRCIKRNGSHALVYPSFEKMDLHDHFQCLLGESISRDLPLVQLGSALSHLMLKTGPTEALWKVSVIPCVKSPQTNFAVVFSISHVIADGATFYKLQNMMFDYRRQANESEASETPIQALVTKRISSTEEQQIKAMGGYSEYKILQSAGFIVNCIGGVLKSLVMGKKYKASSRIYLVDKAEMEVAKKEALAASSTVKDGTAKPLFVSSNDILTSWFLQNCNCKHGVMALNFRGRLEGHSNQHAGNYENVVFYRTADSATPALIRQSVTPSLSWGVKYQRRITHEEPFPSFATIATGSVAIASNWASFAKPCSLPGECECDEDVQIPLYNVESLMPSTMAIMIIFRAGPKGLAVFVSGADDKLKHLESKVPFLSTANVLA